MLTHCGFVCIESVVDIHTPPIQEFVAATGVDVLRHCASMKDILTYETNDTACQKAASVSAGKDLELEELPNLSSPRSPIPVSFGWLP